MSPVLENLNRAVPFVFEGLPSYTRAEIELLKWFYGFFPGGREWRCMVQEVFSGLIEKRSSTTVHLVQTSEIEQQRETREYTFEKAEILIGRNPQNDVVLSAKAVGREHARVFEQGGLYQIEDLGSALGTWLNQKKLEPKQPYRLNNGDVIRTFPYTLTFEAKSAWEPATDVHFHGTPVQSTSWDEFINATPAGSVSYDMTMRPGVGAIRLQASRSFLVKLISRALREQTSGALIASDDGVVEFLLLSILERVNRKVRLPFQFSLEHPRYSPGQGCRGLSFNIFLGIADLAGSLRFFLPYSAIAAMHAAVPAPTPPALLQQVSWPFSISAGNTEFTPEELSTLEAGDIVLFEPEGELLFAADLGDVWPGSG